jgi:hypothetical protein
MALFRHSAGQQSTAEEPSRVLVVAVVGKETVSMRLKPLLMVIYTQTNDRRFSPNTMFRWQFYHDWTRFRFWIKEKP